MIYLVVDEKGQILILKATNMKGKNDEATKKMKVFVFFLKYCFYYFSPLKN
jgi:hypothetical protein